jgi:serine/threonine-protein kinase
MSEEVLNLLTQLPQLRVIARTSSFAFKGRQVSIAEIARTLNVANVLEGSVRKSGDTVRITAQLIRASDSSHLWSQTYDRRLTDVFRIQDEIAGAVVAALKVKLLPAQQVAKPHRAASTDAYNQYLLGNQFFSRSTPDDFRRAVTAYQRAVALDPGFAAAYARLATAEALASDYDETAAKPAAGRQRALALAEKAISLAPDLADGYAERGFLRINWLWDWSGAQADFEKALALEPGNSQAQKGLGELLISLGRQPQSIVEMKKAAELDPLSASTWFDFGWALMAGGQWTDARKALNRALEINPESSFANYGLGCMDLLQGRAQDALTSFRRSNAFWNLAGIAMAQHSLGQGGESQRVLDELIATYAQVAAYQIAEVHAWRGEKDQAFQWLERAYAQRDGGLSTIKADQLLAPLRTDPRFAAMLEKLGLPQ